MPPLRLFTQLGGLGDDSSLDTTTDLPEFNIHEAMKFVKKFQTRKHLTEKHYREMLELLDNLDYANWLLIRKYLDTDVMKKILMESTVHVSSSIVRFVAPSINTSTVRDHISEKILVRSSSDS